MPVRTRIFREILLAFSYGQTTRDNKTRLLEQIDTQINPYQLISAYKIRERSSLCNTDTTIPGKVP